jgi:hypothetical protein
MLNKMCSVPSRSAPGGANSWCNVLAFTKASTELVLMMFGVARVVAGRYSGAVLRILCKLGMCLILANTKKHNGAGLPLSAAAVGCGADGFDAMA